MNNEKPTTKYVKPYGKSESGQAIVIMAGLMIGLLAVLGLAVDGGGMFFMWRDMQNATDASAMAAAYARCTNGDPVAAGLLAARENGFNNDGVNNTVVVNNPPSVPELSGDSSYIEVIIDSEKPAYFIDLVYKEPLVLSNTAISYCDPPFDPSTVGAIFGISNTCQNNVNWTGSSAYIEGDIHSNGDIKIGGCGGDCTMVGESSYVDELSYSDTKVTWDPNPPIQEPYDPTRADPLSGVMQVSKFQPGGAYADASPLYTEITPDHPDFKNGTWKPGKSTLEGMYYVHGDADIGTNTDFGPLGITIIATGEIKFNAGNGKTVSYYTEGPIGVLLYSTKSDDGNCGGKAINASGAHVDMTGVMYAPNSGISFGFSSTTYVGAVVANNAIDLSGSDLNYIYDETLLPPSPPRVQIVD